MLEINSLTPLTNLQPYQRQSTPIHYRRANFDSGLKVIVIIKLGLEQRHSGLGATSLFCNFVDLIMVSTNLLYTIHLVDVAYGLL